MANLGTPKINVTFRELGITAIGRGDKGTVAIIIREAGYDTKLSLSQASDIPTDISKVNQDYISRAFLGYTNPPKKVIVCPFGVMETDTSGTGGGSETGSGPAEELDPVDEEFSVKPRIGEMVSLAATAEAENAETESAAETATLADALSYMATQNFDYIVGPHDCTSEEAALIASWVKSQRTNNGAKYKAVLPNTAADHSAIVNFTSEGMTDGSVIYTTAAYCSRIAGLLAGMPMRISATYAPLPELTDVTRLEKEAQDEAVNRGELILVWDGRKVKVSRAVTSFVTTQEGMLDSFKKIKIVEIMDLIRTDIVQTAEDSYIGKYSNSYDNKLLLITAIRGYFEGLRIDGLVKEGYTVEIDVERQRAYLQSSGMDVDEMSTQEIKEADTGSHVFLLVKCKILDAIEDIDVNIEI